MHFCAIKQWLRLLLPFSNITTKYAQSVYPKANLILIIAIRKIVFVAFRQNGPLQGNLYFDMRTLVDQKHSDWPRKYFSSNVKSELKSQLSRVNNGFKTCKWTISAIGIIKHINGLLRKARDIQTIVDYKQHYSLANILRTEGLNSMTSDLLCAFLKPQSSKLIFIDYQKVFGNDLLSFY